MTTMTFRSRLVRTGLLAAAASCLLVGCGAGETVRDKAETAGESALEKAITDSEQGEHVEDVDVDADAGTITIQGKDGTLLMGEDLPMPAGFPDALPLPEGGHSVNAVVAESGLYEVTMFVTDPDLGAHEEQIRARLAQADYEVAATEEATVDGVAQRVVNAVGRGTDVAVRFSVALGKAVVHYSVKPRS